MPLTPNSKLPYPAATDAADVPADLQKLAVALDTIAYTEFTTGIPITGTTGPAATAIVTAPSVTYDGTPVMIEFFAPRVTLNGSGSGLFVLFTLWDGTTDLGFFGVAQSATAGIYEMPCHLYRRFTPTAAAHVYSVRAWGSGTGVIVTGGAGGAGVALPGFIRIGRG